MMPVLTLACEDAEPASRLADSATLVVFCLCADWCDTCREFRATYERLAAAAPERIFVWLDIEDDSDVCGDVDVDNFPTLAVFRGDSLLHFGASLPQEGNVARLLAAVADRAHPVDVGSNAAQLAGRVRSYVLDKLGGG